MDLFERLSARFSGLYIERNFSFARHTTIGCGGTADAACYPRDYCEAKKTLAYLQAESIPHFVLGAGANVLPHEGRYEGVVVRFTRLNQINRAGNTLFVGAGVTGGALLKSCAAEGIGGFEPFTGIPMTVGGGIAMNAGIKELHFCDVVKSVLAFEGGRLKRMENADCAFRQKDSVFLHGIPVLGAELRAEYAEQKEIVRRILYFRARRKRLPKGRSMGCVFVNPEGDFAGRLIEECLLKGARIGGAFVSEEHANFIINDGGTGDDVRSLLRYVKRTVYEKTGVLLREEVQILP